LTTELGLAESTPELTVTAFGMRSRPSPNAPYSTAAALINRLRVVDSPLDTQAVDRAARI
jgi:hypothetical protein